MGGLTHSDLQPDRPTVGPLQVLCYFGAWAGGDLVVGDFAPWWMRWDFRPRWIVEAEHNSIIVMDGGYPHGVTPVTSGRRWMVADTLLNSGRGVPGFDIERANRARLHRASQL